MTAKLLMNPILYLITVYLIKSILDKLFIGGCDAIRYSTES